MRRVLSLLIVALAATLGVAGCAAASRPAGPTVTLKLSSPQNQSRVPASAITVSGSVSPQRVVSVEVLGRGVPVAADGRFSTTVGLSVGTNLIDVIASAPRSAGAIGVLRITRFLLVAVPQVVGETPGQATTELRSLGLNVQTVGSGDPFNSLLPGSNTVCSVTPGAGTRVYPDSLVVIKTSKFCF